MIRASSCEAVPALRRFGRPRRGYTAFMPIVTKCTVPGCETLTMGPTCVDHEQALQALEAEVTGHAQNSVGASGGGSMPPVAEIPAASRSPRKVAALRGA